MNPNPADEKKLQAKLRADAEEQLQRSRTERMSTLPPVKLLHEVQVHQIELEMQNEELRRAHTALEESRDRYVDLYEFAPIGYLTLTREGLIAEINLTGAAMLGEERKKLLQRRFAQFVVPEERDRWYRNLLQTLQHSDKQNCELALQRGDGTLFHAQLDCLRMAAAAPTVRIALADISERKQAEQALQEADRHKAEFMAMLAHELRNPLTPIRNAAYVISLLGLDEPKLKWAQQLIERQVDHLTHMVDDLLDVSRVTFDKIKLRQESIEFNSLVEQVMESARPLAEEKQQQLRIQLPEQAVQLQGDPMRLCQVLFNLLENASKYTPDGGQIELDARMVGPEIRIGVRDNGMGIPPALLPHVFELFMQGECTLDRPQGGMGIGLPLVKHLVEKHGGRVEAASPGQGMGSCFTLWLPARVLSVQPTDSGSGDQSRSSKVVRVLVVDDEDAVADSTAMLLDSAGYEARTAPDGPSALEMILQFHPQVVLLDIGLKGMNGFETAKRLRELPGGRDLYLLAVTGYGDEATQIRAIASGCDDLLVKPMQWNKLETLLTKVSKQAHTSTP